MATRRPVLNGQVVSIRHLPDRTMVVIEFERLRECCPDLIEALGLAMETGTPVDIHHHD